MAFQVLIFKFADIDTYKGHTRSVHPLLGGAEAEARTRGEENYLESIHIGCICMDRSRYKAKEILSFLVSPRQVKQRSQLYTN